MHIKNEKKLYKQLDWVVVPGGPGLSNEYLKTGLKDSFSSFKLHYYNQLGSPECITNKTPTIEELVDEIFRVADKNKLSQFGLICHSFGSYLSLRALEKINNNILAIIMINPMPFNFSQWQQALKNIAQSIPQEELIKINQLAIVDKIGEQVFAAYFPYYTANKIHLPFSVKFSGKLCNEISAQIKNYDDLDLVKYSTIPISCIVGEKDEFYKIKVLNIGETVISGVGHYSFFEDKDAFAITIKEKLQEKLI